MTKINVTNVDLVKFAQKVYELSVPQGMGFMHYTPEPLSEEKAKQCIQESGRIALNMDYVDGRACKMHVRRDEDGSLWIGDSWYDHTDRIYDTLLEEFGLSRDSGSAPEHGCACNCIDCQSKAVIS